MTASNDQVFESLVDNFAKIEQDENKNVEKQEATKEEDKATGEGKSPKQGDKEKTQIKKLSEQELPEVEDLVHDIYSWIEFDVSEEQIKSVLWGIMMYNNDPRVLEVIRTMREDYEAERMKAEEE